jgi:hypothetical protein
MRRINRHSSPFFREVSPVACRRHTAKRSTGASEPRTSRRSGTITVPAGGAATDHSPYMNRCIERLLCFAPLGVEHVTICRLSRSNWKDYARICRTSPLTRRSPAARFGKQNQQLIERLDAGDSPRSGALRHRCRAIQSTRLSAKRCRTRVRTADTGGEGHSFLDRFRSVASRSIRR